MDGWMDGQGWWTDGRRNKSRCFVLLPATQLLWHSHLMFFTPLYSCFWFKVNCLWMCTVTAVRSVSYCVMMNDYLFWHRSSSHLMWKRRFSMLHGHDFCSSVKSANRKKCLSAISDGSIGHVSWARRGHEGNNMLRCLSLDVHSSTVTHAQWDPSRCANKFYKTFLKSTFWLGLYLRL